jgi:hypothetical protein
MRVRRTQKKPKSSAHAAPNTPAAGHARTNGSASFFIKMPVTYAPTPKYAACPKETRPV